MTSPGKTRSGHEQQRTQAQHSQYAFLVAQGLFAEHIGLSQKLQAVPLEQKRYTHTPQAKVMEFLVATLAGLEHLQDISLAAHPLAKDRACCRVRPGPALGPGRPAALVRQRCSHRHR